jgi:hypothetical protein
MYNNNYLLASRQEGEVIISKKQTYMEQYGMIQLGSKVASFKN